MPVRNHIPPSPVKVNLEEESLMKHGIVTILQSDCGTGSIRRTLSADMSSKKWLEQNGFLSPMKKTVSSEALLHPPHEHIPNQDDVWAKIQERNQIQKPCENQVWGSILSQKSDNSALPLPPYVHPLVKTSSTTLTHKSLEICTEGLGSETGSDCFSSDEDGPRLEAEELKDSNPSPNLHVPKYRKSPPRPFPPPLPSASLHMQSHRENGRLVLEAVSVTPRNYFHAQRQDGRLLLTLIHAPPTYSPPEDEEIENDMEGIDEEQVVVEDKSLSLPSGMIKAHKSGMGMGMKKVVGNINPKKMDEELPIPQSLPPRFNQPSFNVYDYFWRNKTAAGFLNPMITNKMNGYENQDLVLIRANKTEQFVPYLRGCKEARRPLPIPHPSCWIATS